TVPVRPTITLATPVVVVKKSYTSPARQAVTLRTDAAFPRTGTFTRSSAAIRFFTAAAGGTEITFNATDNVFTWAQLTPGGRLFAEGPTPTPSLNAVQLTLTRTPAQPPASIPAGAAANATMTSVELTMDIFMSRTAAGVDPTPLPQPPAAPPAPGTTPTDKW